MELTLFLLAILAFAGWAVWRGIEAHMFNRLVGGLDGEPTDQKVRAFIDGLAGRNVPNYSGLWDRLRRLEARVMQTSAVSAELKAELHTMLESKGVQF